jgi:hypothetical protein
MGVTQLWSRIFPPHVFNCQNGTQSTNVSLKKRNIVPWAMVVRLATALATAAAVAMAAVLLVSSSQRPAALLQQRRRGRTSARFLPALRSVRAPGDEGVGGHGIGGEICSYEINQMTGLGEWTCPRTEETLAAAKGLKPRPLAQMLRVEVEKHGAAGCNYECDDDAMLVHQCGWTCPPTAELPPIVLRTADNSYFSQAGWTRPSGYWGAKARRATLFDFGNRAPSEGYAAAYADPAGPLYNEDALGALPPMDWGDNYDGKNFFAFYPEEQDFTGIPAYAKLDGDYWESVHGGVPTPLPFDLEEVLCVCARACAWLPCARVLRPRTACGARERAHATPHTASCRRRLVIAPLPP